MISFQYKVVIRWDLQSKLKSSLSPSKNENKLDKDHYCALLKFMLMCFIQRNQEHRDSVMHEFSSNVNKVNKTVAKVRTIGDRPPLKAVCHAFDSVIMTIQRIGNLNG